LKKWFQVHVYSTEKMFFTTMFTDITHTKKQHEELEGFFSVSLDFFCIADLEGNFVKINEAWSRFLGYSVEELHTKKFLEFVHPDDLPATLEAMKILGNGKDVNQFTNRFLTAGGTYRHNEWRAHPKGKLVYASARDVTEQKNLFDALTKSEARYRSLVEQMQEGLLVDDMNGHITYVNPRFCKMVEYDEHELIGKNGYDLLLPQKSKEIVFDKDKNRLKGIAEQYELVLKKKSGGYVELLLNAAPIRNDVGQVIGSVSTCADISELKSVELELSRTKEEMQLAMQLAKVGCWSKNLIQQHDFWCETTREIHEVPPDFIPGMQNAINFYKPGKSRNLITDVVSKAINTGEAYDIEVQLITAKGNERWVRTIGKPEFGDDGKCSRLFGAIQDITEQKKRNEKLAASERFQSQLNNIVFKTLGTQNSEELLITISENISALFNADGCYITSWDEKMKKTIPVASSAIPTEEYQATLQATPELTMTQSVLDAQHPLVAEDVFNTPYMSRQIAKQFSTRSMLGLPLISGNVKLGAILIGFNSPHKFSDDEIKHGEIVARDISLVVHKMRIMDELRQSEYHLQQLNSQKDKFFNIIAHDLKSPFNAIMGFSELLVEQISEKDYDGIDQYASIIQKSSQHAIDLLMNLLDWARSQTGRMEFIPEYFEMVDLTDETFDQLNDAAIQKAITLRKELPKNLPVFADKNMISTVIRNLISNAIKYTGEGGEIVLSAKKNPDNILVSVKDNGLGIAPDRINKLFRIDTNVSTPGTKNEKGTGLGLILCKEFIEKHDGKIWVESAIGQGSVFSFSIPLKSY